MVRDFNHNDIEFALRVLYHPDRVDEEEMRLWFADRKNRKLFEELRQYREVGFEDTGVPAPDLKAQWNMLQQRVRRDRKIQQVRWFSAVAAVVIILFGITFLLRPSSVPEQKIMPELKPPVVQLAGEKSVRLIMENGREIALSTRGILPDRIPGVERICVDSLEGIRYTDSKKKKTEYHTLEIPRGAEYMVILDDGTEVWLNAESILRYPTHFDGEERVVELLGEGYFEVKQDPERPFIVRTAQVDARVLGTEFNVQAYEHQPVNVTLVEGSVAVKEKVGEEIILKPGENANLTGGVLSVEKVDVQLYTSWKEGFFYYEDVRLEDLLSELGRWYDFTVFFQNPEARDYRFKFWADRKENFESVISRLSETATVTLLINDRNVVVCSD